MKLAPAVTLPEVARFAPPPPALPAADLIAEVARRLHGAERPLILLGRMSRREADWRRRVELAEALGAVVVTDGKLGAAFPTAHPLYGAPATTFATPPVIELLRQAEVVLALDCVDLGGLLNAARRDERDGPFGVHAPVDPPIHNAAGIEHPTVPPPQRHHRPQA